MLRYISKPIPDVEGCKNPTKSLEYSERDLAHLSRIAHAGWWWALDGVAVRAWLKAARQGGTMRWSALGTMIDSVVIIILREFIGTAVELMP